MRYKDTVEIILNVLGAFNACCVVREAMFPGARQFDEASVSLFLTRCQFWSVSSEQLPAVDYVHSVFSARIRIVCSRGPNIIICSWQWDLHVTAATLT